SRFEKSRFEKSRFEKGGFQEKEEVRAGRARPFPALALPDHSAAALVKLDECIHLLFGRLGSFPGETRAGRRLSVTGGDGDKSHQLQRDLLFAARGTWS